MSDAGRKNPLFLVYLVISVVLCFTVPGRRSNQLRYFIKYIYYTPFAKSVDALSALSQFPGKLYRLSKTAGDNRFLRREILEKDFKIQELSGEIKRRDEFSFFSGNDFFLKYKPVPATPYGHLGESSNILLLRNRNFKQGSAAVSFIDGKWVLLGSITEGGSPRVASVLLTTNKTSRVSIVGSSGKFWAVLVGKSDGFGTLDFIWPSRAPEIKAGETLLTSGWDGKFPPGLVCGTVLKVTKNRAGEFFAPVASAYDVNNVKDVFILRKKE